MRRLVRSDERRRTEDDLLLPSLPLGIVLPGGIDNGNLGVVGGTSSWSSTVTPKRYVACVSAGNGADWLAARGLGIGGRSAAAGLSCCGPAGWWCGR
jgi:hypothetical protein